MKARSQEMHVGIVSMPLALLAVSFGMGAILLETVFHVSLRLPGHRAFPTALVLLLFAESFAPLLFVLMTTAVAATMLIVSDQPLAMGGVWAVPALAALLVSRRRFRQSVGFFLALGGLVGLLRFVVLMPGLHHTPDPVRLGGHLAFGLVAGLMAFGISRGMRRFAPGEP